LADHASPELGELRRRVQNYHERLKRRVEGYLKSTDLQTHLQDNYYTLRNERYVLPVKSGSRGHLPGIVHGTSGSGQTLFIEPTELVELNNDLQLAQMEVAEEEQRILGRLSTLVAQGAPKLEANGGLLAYLDLTSAMARLSSLLRASRPTLSTRGALVLTQARHPLLVLRALSAEKPFDVIPNDIELGELVLPPKPVRELAALAAGGEEQEEGAPVPEGVPTRQQILIISGPNAGGKTVTLKTMGLCCLMARAGMHVPAEPGAEVPLVNSVFSDIGDEQSIERDLSTFSGHVVNLSGFLRRVDDKSLVLLDELFAGTDPAQGAALARAVLTWLAEKGALVAVTTHLETLKTLAFQDARFANAAVGFDLDQLRPTYALHIGLPGSSYALRIAQRLGLPQGILDRAWQHSDNAGQADIERVLRQLERQRDKLSHERDQVRRLKQEADTIKKDYDKQLADLRKREERMVHKETRALMAEVETARDLIRRHIKALHEAPPREAAGGPSAMTQEQLHETRKEVNEVAQKASDLLKEKEVELVRQERAPALPNRLQEGQEVWVRTFKRTGQVVELQHDRGRAVVQVGGIRATVTLEELYHLKSGEGAPIPKPRPVHADTPAKNETSLRIVGPQTPDNTVDLRGLMVDEALERLEIFLDAAYRAQEAGAYVIHGHGTGALKRAVRQFAAQARYLAHHRPGEQGEGGDGVTLVFFEN
jgi:DNA mismatch repair protein MutS2